MEETNVECVYCGYVDTIENDYLEDTEFINCPNCGKVEFFIKEEGKNNDN